MEKILIVDDDASLRSAMIEIIGTKEFEIVEAEDGKAALSLLRLRNFDLIISDVRMPHMNGIELLYYAKRQKNIPFVLMTGFSDIMESKEAFEIGATDFLTKPFSPTDLRGLINRILKSKEEPSKITSTLNLDSQFCKVSIDEFITGNELCVDIYIRLSPLKYLMVAKEGMKIDVDRIKTYKMRGLDFLYIEKSQFRKYVGFNMRVTQAAVKSEKITHTQRLIHLKNTTELILQDSYSNGLDIARFTDAKNLVTATVETLSSDGETASLLEILNSSNDSLYAHSVGVALYSSLLAQQLGWDSTQNLFKITMGGLLHDIGKKELDPSITSKPRRALNADEVKLYESHTVRGRDILIQMPNVPTEVVMIVLQHHENLQGAGFPAGLPDLQIHPMAKLVGLIDK